MAKVGSFNLNVNGESVGLAERDAATKAAKDAETRSNDALKNVKIAEKNQNEKKKYLSPAIAAAFASLTTITAVEKEKQLVKARLTAKTKECEVVRPAIVLCDTPGTYSLTHLSPTHSLTKVPPLPTLKSMNKPHYSVQPTSSRRTSCTTPCGKWALAPRWTG
jgi:hypothetical protein